MNAKVNFGSDSGSGSPVITLTQPRRATIRIKKTYLCRGLAIVLLTFIAGCAMFANQLIGHLGISADVSLFIGFVLLTGFACGFMFSGGKRITSMSVIFIAFAINLGFPALYISISEGHDEYQTATTIGLIPLMVALFLVKEKPETTPLKGVYELWPNLLPFFLYPAFLGFFIFNPLLEVFWRPIIGLWPAVFAASAAFALSKRKYFLSVLFILSSLGSMMVYDAVAFHKFGRLNIVAMMFAVVIVLSWVRPSWVYKTATLLATPIGLIWAGVHRAFHGSEIVNLTAAKDVFESGVGLGSILAPFEMLSMIVARSDPSGIHSAAEWLDQVVFSLLFWFPRAVWSDKPEGFGRVMVYEFTPHLEHTGHSIAASIFGEFIYYFGIFGPMLGFLSVIALAWMLTRGQNWALSNGSKEKLFCLAVIAYMLAQVLTFVWGGIAAYVVRGIAPAIGLVALLIFWWIIRGGIRFGIRKSQASR